MNRAARECEEAMRRMTGGERGCVNPAEHEVPTRERVALVAVILGFVVLVWIGLTATADAVLSIGPQMVPACAEDEVIVGMGEYANGYSVTYECVHFEDAAKAWAA